MTPDTGYYDDDYNLHQSKQGDDAYWELVRLQDERARQQRLRVTGRCKRCGSNDLWDDNAHYGCNTCGAFLL